MNASRIRLTAGFIATVALVFANPAVAATPATLTPIEGGGQIAVTNSPFPLQLTARVTDAAGAPVEGAPVHFAIDHCAQGHVFCLLPSGYPFFPGHNFDAVVMSDADGNAVSPAIEAGDVGTLDVGGFQDDVVATIDGASGVAPAYFWIVQVDPSPSVAITSAFTGAWYDPTRSGQGLMLEVLPGNQLLAYWFAFTRDGQQAWFGGVGPIVGNEAVVYAQQGAGGRWIPDFNPAGYVKLPWGTLGFRFSDCNHGRVYFAGAGQYSDWSTGYMDLTRLTMPAGLSCS